MIDVDGVHYISELYKKEIAVKLKSDLLSTYLYCKTNEYNIDATAIGKRKLKNLALHYLMYLNDPEIFNLCCDQYYNSNNMTDVFSSFIALVNSEYPAKQEIFNDFYSKWQQYPLVVDKWFSAHAITKQNETLQKVKKLTSHQDFLISNPNRVRALIATFTKLNHINFHQIDGDGYRFLKDMLMKIDPLNPQLSSLLVKPLINWQRFDKIRGESMREQLHIIVSNESISKNLREIVEKAW